MSQHWVPEVIEIAQDHAVKQLLFGIGLPGKKDQGWSIRDTAKMLGVSIGTVHNAIKLFAKLQEDPNICLKSKREALKIIKL